jgi:putative intracellular protease/amidase
MSRTTDVLFVLTSHGELGGSGKPTGFWLAEAAHPWQVFTAAGLRVEFVSIRGGRSPVDGADRADPVQRAFLAQVDLAAARPVESADPAGYRAVFYVGGHGAMWDFPGNPAVARLGTEIYAAGGVVAAVCHGPAGLLDLRRPDGTHLLAGADVTSFSNAEEAEIGLDSVVPFLLQTALEQRGARHTDAGIFAPHVVVDGRLVTGQNPPSSAGVAQEVIRLLAAQ